MSHKYNPICSCNRANKKHGRPLCQLCIDEHRPGPNGERQQIESMRRTIAEAERLRISDARRRHLAELEAAGSVAGMGER